MEWAIDRETVLTSRPVRWLLCEGKAANGVSVLGGVVAMILDKVFGGIHNVPLTKAPVAWEDDYVVHVTLSWQTLATVDDSRLTALVVLAHDNALRLQISAKAANHIELMFHQRQRAGSLSQRCPTLEEHVERIRGAAPKSEDSFPIAMYELERDEYDGAIVLRRGVFERYDNRVAWYVTRDVQSGLAMVVPKESGNKSGLFCFHVISREDDMTPYLWDTPSEAFRWWRANRQQIVAFTSDRLRLRDEVQKVEDDSDGN